jgi:PAS domain S-box-containing protein
MSLMSGVEHSLSEYQELFKQLVGGSPDAIMRHDANLRCVYANSTLVMTSGQPIETIVGALPPELPFIFDAKAYGERLHNVLRLGTPSGFEMEWGLPDGTLRWCQVRLVPERDAQGTVIGVMSVSHDITALKDLQSKLEKAEVLAKMGFWELDLAVNSARMSDQACRLVGREPGWAPTAEGLAFGSSTKRPLPPVRPASATTTPSKWRGANAICIARPRSPTTAEAVPRPSLLSRRTARSAPRPMSYCAPASKSSACWLKTTPT